MPVYTPTHTATHTHRRTHTFAHRERHNHKHKNRQAHIHTHKGGGPGDLRPVQHHGACQAPDTYMVGTYTRTPDTHIRTHEQTRVFIRRYPELTEAIFYGNHAHTRTHGRTHAHIRTHTCTRTRHLLIQTQARTQASLTEPGWGSWRRAATSLTSPWVRNVFSI